MSISVSSITNEKARNWITGRKKLLQNIQSSLQPDEKRIWIHCASLGEFEQGRPVLDAIKQQYPDYKIVLTFYSPSGYVIRQNYEKADYVFYLPLDTKKNAEKFISLVNPKLAIFVKYEFWHHFLNTLDKKNIPLLLISAIFREEQPFFKWYGGLFINMLNKFSHIFVQDKKSKQLLEKNGIKNVRIAPDTRFDRVRDIAATSSTIDIVEKFLDHKHAIIAGSTWEEDEEILIKFINNNPALKYIIAPHEIDADHIEHIRSGIDRPAVLYSEAADPDIEVDVKVAEVLIIDNIGMLSSLYRYAFISYVGGGFGDGIHNTLEPAVYGIPVVFGPHYHKFKEAVDLIQAGAAFSVHNYDELETLFYKLLNNRDVHSKASKEAHHYIEHHLGGTEIIMTHLDEYL